ncbi:hypothetical protein FT663_03871 [Candidozyma haemuli var. vulneris]|uniref:Vacuolar protein sorting-associated protein 27 n=1 Tax=Candidozyma haemuli TaxID=45357 RepID=A0A2V1AN55_9ASCO|nr:hypothetical protein CXQ85_001594 [[Candida] haemuloni]KAF3987552.1 hypothetical protein FT662_03923 [[Candida] haemuloni var. vulneris]KAF3988832.1 hypothetical protein FT663_03871 [[Candida] haemuloni var. vulneris]PVH19288.1 hypothetical protein CXQ85_001594 [[Candida] haemuloni]
MSWFSGSDPVAELDAKIEEASSETIPNGEMDIAVGLEITDIIRSKKVPPKNAMRSLKKRLTKVHQNPNLLLSTLKVIDLCVKNCGAHFLSEINQKEFVDYLVDYIFKVHYDVKDYKVYSSEAKYKIGTSILKYIKEWNLCLKDSTNTRYLDRVYESLMSQGYDFPEVDSSLLQSASTFADSRAPPDWIDGNECMICYNPFSVMTRKHHCRACGGVFCQAHSSNSIPLPALGILQPVRVCDDCYQIHKSKTAGVTKKTTSRQPNASAPAQSNAPQESEEDEQLRKAIELSLQESQGPAATNYAPPPTAPPPAAAEPMPETPQVDDEDMDEDMKAAIQASLQEYKQEQSLRQPAAPAQQDYPQYPPQQSAPEPQSEFYQSSLPFDLDAYSQPSQPQPQAPGPSNPSFYAQTPQHTSGPAAGQQPVQPQETSQGRLSPQKTKAEDLTEEEEESINLYLQLINGLKTDRSKQANVLYDQNLSELHAKVIRLKPKLNRSLRTSIEKYDQFLEMNNKLSTITRLYDQFLEAKLNQAYNRHSLSSPQYGQAQMYGLPPQGTGASGYPQYGAQQPPQNTSKPLPQQPTAPSVQDEQQHTGTYPVKRQGTGYPQQARPYSSTAPYPFDPNNIQSNPSQQSEMSQGSSTAVSYNPSFPSYPSQPDFDDDGPSEPAETNGTTRQDTGFYPTEPSLGESDGESTNSVASRYPPVAGGEFGGLEPQPTAGQHASERYPTIDEMEQKDERNTLPTMAHPQGEKRPKSEPEPLIEL